MGGRTLSRLVVRLRRVKPIFAAAGHTLLGGSTNVWLDDHIGQPDQHRPPRSLGEVPVLVCRPPACYASHRLAIPCKYAVEPLAHLSLPKAETRLAQQPAFEGCYATLLYRETIALTLRIGAIRKEMSQLATSVQAALLC